MSDAPVHVGALAKKLLEKLDEVHAKARASSRVKDDKLYLCPRCLDAGWLETGEDQLGPPIRLTKGRLKGELNGGRYGSERGVVRRCTGPKGAGCAEIARRVEKARRDAGLKASGAGQYE